MEWNDVHVRKEIISQKLQALSQEIHSHNPASFTAEQRKLYTASYLDIIKEVAKDFESYPDHPFSTYLLSILHGLKVAYQLE